MADIVQQSVKGCAVCAEEIRDLVDERLKIIQCTNGNADKDNPVDYADKTGPAGRSPELVEEFVVLLCDSH